MDDIDAFTAARIGTIDGLIAGTITIATTIATTIDPSLAQVVGLGRPARVQVRPTP
jgi:hypothetical protein